MDTDPTERLGTASSLPWNQTSFLGAADAGRSDPLRAGAVEEALSVATQAVDAHSRRAALDHLYTQLAQQAEQRGRRAVPKRSPRDAGVAS